MQKYRKKPVVIEAIQWTGINKISICDFVGMNLESTAPPHGFEYNHNIPDNAVTIKIPTLEGVMTANRFDYIIKGVHGEFYPCKPDIFEKTYEKID